MQADLLEAGGHVVGIKDERLTHVIIWPGDTTRSKQLYHLSVSISFHCNELMKGAQDDERATLQAVRHYGLGDGFCFMRASYAGERIPSNSLIVIIDLVHMHATSLDCRSLTQSATNRISNPAQRTVYTLPQL